METNMSDERNELEKKAQELLESEAMGCGDGFVKGPSSLMEKRADSVKQQVDPQIIKDKAKALKESEALGCGDGFVRAIEK